jgi:phospholipase C
VVSPRLRKRFSVDHTQYDTTSIAATIERRFGLRPLSTRDARVNSLLQSR